MTPDMAPAWPSTQIICYALVRGASEHIGHRPLVSNFTRGDPNWSLYDLWSQQCTTLWSGVLLNILAIGHWWAILPVVTLTTCDMTFDPSNVVRSGEEFFLPNLVATWHSREIWLLVDRAGWHLHDLWSQECITRPSRGSSHQIWCK